MCGYPNCIKSNGHLLCRRSCCILMGILSYSLVRRIHQDSGCYNLLHFFQDYMLPKTMFYQKIIQKVVHEWNAKSWEHIIPMHLSPLSSKFEQYTPTLKQKINDKNNKQNHLVRSSFFISSHITLPTHVRIHGNRAWTYMDTNCQ